MRGPPKGLSPGALAGASEAQKIKRRSGKNRKQEYSPSRARLQLAFRWNSPYRTSRDAGCAR